MKQGPQRPENRPIVYPKRPDPRANTLPLNSFAAKQKVGVAISACTIAFSFAVPPLVHVLVLLHQPSSRSRPIRFLQSSRTPCLRCLLHLLGKPCHSFGLCLLKCSTIPTHCRHFPRVDPSDKHISKLSSSVFLATRVVFGFQYLDEETCHPPP